MTDRELMQQALEALQSSVPTQDGFLKHCKAMNHIRIRLTQPEPEPNYWLGYGLQAHTEKPFEGATPLYIAPLQHRSLTEKNT